MSELDILFKRKSVRTYTGIAPSKEQIETILKAAQSSPVALDKHENYRIDIISDKEILEVIELGVSVKSGSEKHPLYGAPVFILISVRSDSSEVSGAEYSTAGIIAHNMLLAAESQGLGACYVWGAIRMNEDNPIFESKLDLPEDYSPICGITVGHTDEEFELRDIENRIEVVFREGEVEEEDESLDVELS